MCLLITQTNNTPISEKKLKNADENNPHGMGFTYSNGEKLIIEKFRNSDLHMTTSATLLFLQGFEKIDPYYDYSLILDIFCKMVTFGLEDAITLFNFDSIFTQIWSHHWDQRSIV